MTQQIDNGGPAFPRMRYYGHNVKAGEPVMESLYGMTLRDWFAGQALAGEMARGLGGTTVDMHADWCYKVADAMLAARQR